MEKNHNANECHFKETECHNCGKVGHIKKACCAKTRAEDTRSRDKRQQKKNTKYVKAEEDSDLEMLTVWTVTSEATELYKATFSVNGVDLEMEVDTGARKSIISERTYRRQFSHIPCRVLT